MNKVATDRQIELCKWGAIQRCAQHGIGQEQALQLFNYSLNKLAQKTAQVATPEQQIQATRILASGIGAGGGAVGGLGIGAGIGGITGLIKAIARRNDIDPETGKKRTIGNALGTVASNTAGGAGIGGMTGMLGGGAAGYLSGGKLQQLLANANAQLPS